jgi:DUF3102 family protein
VLIGALLFQEATVKKTKRKAHARKSRNVAVTLDTLALVGVAREIKEAHDAVATAMRESLRHARRAGELLSQVKDQLPHGEFGPWIDAHCGFGWRTANLYMRIAREWEKLVTENRNAIANLTLGEAMDLLTRVDTGEVAEQAADLVALGVLDADALGGLSPREQRIVVSELRLAYDETVEDEAANKRLPPGGFKMTPQGLLFLAREALDEVRTGAIGIGKFRNKVRPDQRHWSLRRSHGSVPKWRSKSNVPFIDLAYRLLDEARAVVQQVEHGDRIGSNLNLQMRAACTDVTDVLQHVKELLHRGQVSDKDVTPEPEVDSISLTASSA